jgi:thiamine-phosphate pyrophosphorylase
VTVGPVVCVITDRRRAGGSAGDPFTRLVDQVTRAAQAGVDLIQVRERDLDGGALLRLVRACLSAVHGTRTRVLVNDRVDVALAAGAHGVHLRGPSMPATRVRRIVPPGFLIGRSVHAVDEAEAVTREGGLDYLLFGTVLATASKPGRAPAGIEALARVVTATALPVLAVGGIGPDTACAVGATGAAGFAAIGLFAEADSPEAVVRVVTGTRAAFASGAARGRRQ